MKKSVLLFLTILLLPVEAMAGTMSVYSPGYGASGLTQNTIIGHSPRPARYNRYNSYNQYNPYNQYGNRRYRNSGYYNHNRRYRNNPYYNYNGYNRRPIIFRSFSHNNIKDNNNEAFVSYNTKSANFEYPKISEAERAILGRTYESQDLNLRLSRLERSVFNKTYPSMSYEQRVNNLLVNYNNSTVPQIPLNGLTRMEQKVFNKNYSFDTPQARVERLEQKMFGASQTGSLKERYSLLSRAVKNNSIRQPSMAQGYAPQTYDDNYYSPPIVSGGGWKSMIGSIGNYMMGGYPTGMSPQMDPAYMDYFEAQRYCNDGGDDQYVRSNRGYSYNNIQRGTGTGVTILD